MAKLEVASIFSNPVPFLLRLSLCSAFLSLPPNAFALQKLWKQKKIVLPIYKKDEEKKEVFFFSLHAHVPTEQWCWGLPSKRWKKVESSLIAFEG